MTEFLKNKIYESIYRVILDNGLRNDVPGIVFKPGLIRVLILREPRIASVHVGTNSFYGIIHYFKLYSDGKISIILEKSDSAKETFISDVNSKEILLDDVMSIDLNDIWQAVCTYDIKDYTIGMVEEKEDIEFLINEFGQESECKPGYTDGDESSTLKFDTPIEFEPHYLIQFEPGTKIKINEVSSTRFSPGSDSVIMLNYELDGKKYIINYDVLSLPDRVTLAGELCSRVIPE